MSSVTVGRISSIPDKDGRHQLRCPRCKVSFAAPIIRDDDTQKLENITCDGCGYREEPLVFLHQANKQVADNMVYDYAMREIKKALGDSKRIKIKV